MSISPDLEDQNVCNVAKCSQVISDQCDCLLSEVERLYNRPDHCTRTTASCINEATSTEQPKSFLDMLLVSFSTFASNSWGGSTGPSAQ